MSISDLTDLSNVFVRSPSRERTYPLLPSRTFNSYANIPPEHTLRFTFDRLPPGTDTYTIHLDAVSNRQTIPVGWLTFSSPTRATASLCGAWEQARAQFEADQREKVDKVEKCMQKLIQLAGKQATSLDVSVASCAKQALVSEITQESFPTLLRITQTLEQNGQKKSTAVHQCAYAFFKGNQFLHFDPTDGILNSNEKPTSIFRQHPITLREPNLPSESFTLEVKIPKPLSQKSEKFMRLFLGGKSDDDDQASSAQEKTAEHLFQLVHEGELNFDLRTETCKRVIQLGITFFQGAQKRQTLFVDVNRSDLHLGAQSSTLTLGTRGGHLDIQLQTSLTSSETNETIIKKIPFTTRHDTHGQSMTSSLVLSPTKPPRKPSRKPSSASEGVIRAPRSLSPTD